MEKKTEKKILHASDCALSGVYIGVNSVKSPDGISYEGPCDCGAEQKETQGEFKA